MTHTLLPFAPLSILLAASPRVLRRRLGRSGVLFALVVAFVLPVSGSALASDSPSQATPVADSPPPLRYNPWADRGADYLEHRRWEFELDVRAARVMRTTGWVFTGVHVGMVLADLMIPNQFGFGFFVSGAITMGIWTPFGVAGWAGAGTARALRMEPDDRRLVPTVIVHRKRAAARGLLYVAGVTGATAGAYLLRGLVSGAHWTSLPQAPCWLGASISFLISAGITRMAADIDEHRFGLGRPPGLVDVRVTPGFDPRGGGTLTLSGAF